MSKLPVVAAQSVIKALARVGYEFDHQRGSHIVLRQSTAPYRRVTIPNHKEIARGTPFDYPGSRLDRGGICGSVMRQLDGVCAIGLTQKLRILNILPHCSLSYLSPLD
jgi:predicted RNA binding protein YcfA (HicA-like mRNA interferase family)